MEENKKETNDPAYYHGGMIMDAVNRNIHMLLQSVKKSSIYKEYRLQEKILKQNPELENRVRQFRAAEGIEMDIPPL